MITVSFTEYITNGGSYCPHCGSDDLSISNSNQDYDCITQDVYCDNCLKQWQDIYTLTGAEAIK